MEDLNGPFRGSLAVAAGLVTKGQLRGSTFRRLFPDIYLSRDVAPTLATRSRGAQLLVSGYGALAGYSAAELLGARIAPRDADAEVVVPGGEFRECRGLRVHREQLADDEVETVSGLVVTSAIRTAYDLARWSTQVEGVVAADALGQIAGFGSAALLGISARYPGARWRSRVPLVAELMDPRAESAMETRCRVSLVLRGLPRPELQYQVRDELGNHVARLDMAYPAAKAGVEFDGEHHQEALTFRTDLARHNRLAALGWTVLRASAADVLRNPDAFAAQVRAILHHRAA
ncbi:MAG: endonuclease domain-containing protein [Pseudonocardiaceae bacterium]